MFTKATTIVHNWIRDLVLPGNLVVDATCGNGHDTLLLADLVGPDGQVIATDIQSDAIDTTREVLEEAGLAARCSLHCMSHDRLAEILPEDAQVHCGVFNLGYLPGGDKTVVTRPESSLHAHQMLLERLAPGGVIISTVYIGHEGGTEEAEAILTWSRGLDAKRFSVARHEWINQQSAPPFILVIQRRP